MNLHLFFLLLFCPGALCDDGHVHEVVEIRVDPRGKQSPSSRVKPFLNISCFLESFFLRSFLESLSTSSRAYRASSMN
jgi:hypothetical protein